MYKLVIAPLKERRIYGENRHHTASCKSRGKGYGVFFGYADIIKSVGKLLPEFFKTETGIDKFANFLRTFVDLEIPHIQFNVVRKEDLLAAKKNPEQYRGLTVRVAGYTAYFTELADELQNEIIARTSYGDI